MLRCHECLQTYGHAPDVSGRPGDVGVLSLFPAHVGANLDTRGPSAILSSEPCRSVRAGSTDSRRRTRQRRVQRSGRSRLWPKLFRAENEQTRRANAALVRDHSEVRDRSSE